MPIAVSLPTVTIEVGRVNPTDRIFFNLIRISPLKKKTFTESNINVSNCNPCTINRYGSHFSGKCSKHFFMLHEK